MKAIVRPGRPLTAAPLQAERTAGRGPLGRAGRRARRRALRHFPAPLLAAGLAAFVLGAAADLLYHGIPQPYAEPLAPLLGAGGAGAHLTTFAGMALILAAVAVKGLRRDR